MEAVLIGVFSSFVASVVFTAVSFFIKPKIEIADKMCVTRQGGNATYQVKIVNKTHMKVINVNYTLTYCKVDTDGLIEIDTIKPLKEVVTVLERMNRKNTEYAVRLTFQEVPELLLNDKNYLEFVIQATHPITGSSVCNKRIYSNGDLFTGEYESGKSMKFVSRRESVAR